MIGSSTPRVPRTPMRSAADVRRIHYVKLRAVPIVAEISKAIVGGFQRDSVSYLRQTSLGSISSHKKTRQCRRDRLRHTVFETHRNFA